MATDRVRWEYQTIKLDVSGWFGPDVETDEVTAQMNAAGADGWELASAFDVNRGRGTTSEIVLIFKRARR
jgi:hypothetical protein